MAVPALHAHRCLERVIEAERIQRQLFRFREACVEAQASELRFSQKPIAWFSSSDSVSLQSPR
jgi:hypothetical protein